MEIYQGKIVRFEITPEIKGFGKICGVATIDFPILGRSIILQILSNEGFSIRDYPYSHMVAFESQLKEID